MALVNIAVSIPAGQSLSNAVDCGSGQLIRVAMPPAWDGGNLTFQASSDGGATYQDVFDSSGLEVMVPVKIGSVVPVSQQIGGLTQAKGDWTLYIGFVRLRAGSRDYPFVQSAQRDFVLVVSQ